MVVEEEEEEEEEEENEPRLPSSSSATSSRDDQKPVEIVGEVGALALSNFKMNRDSVPNSQHTSKQKKKSLDVHVVAGHLSLAFCN